MKYLGVFLKWMVYGDVTIWIALNSASTISLPVSRCRNTDMFPHKLITENFLISLCPSPLDTIILLVTFMVKYYESHVSKYTEWPKNILHFSPLSVSTLTATNMGFPTRLRMSGKVCVMCSLFSVAFP